MPSRHAYWTILIGDQPTAFRADNAEALRATLNRLREKHPSAVMKWFERGRLWTSREAAREQGRRGGPGPKTPAARRRPFGRPAVGWRDRDKAGTPRGGDWRPGGEHRDPRQRYKDAKKARWQRFRDKIRGRHGGRGQAPRQSPHGATRDKPPRDMPRSPEIVHVVLFRPKQDLTPDARAALVGALDRALRDIPTIARAHVGRRVAFGRAYDQHNTADFPYAAILEFASAADLGAYLDHPAHAALGEQFYIASDAALAFDFELIDPARVGTLLHGSR
jgi:hypothetical protein